MVYKIFCLLFNEKGQGTAEYSLILGLIAIAVIYSISDVREWIQNTYLGEIITLLPY